MGEFHMPSLGADMENGTVLEWRVGPGDKVHRGDIVAVVDTEKATIEIEIFEDGVIDEIVVPVGEEVPVGTVLAYVAPVAAEAPAGRAPPGAPPAERKPAPAKRAKRPRRAPPRAAAGHVRASPLARRRAAERHLDLAGVAGSGPGGAVVATDVERAAIEAPRTAVPPAPPTQPGPPAPEPTPARPAEHPERHTAGPQERADAMRQAIAALMARSKREIPHYYLATTIDFGPAREWLTAQNATRPPDRRLLAGALLLKATALAARAVPELNGFWDTAFRPSAAVHLGVAVSLRGGGLVAPAIHDANRLGLDETMDALRDLVRRARTGRLRGSEMADPTITVTNLGDQGVDEVHGVIYPPQVALVGFGKIVERPWAAGGMLGVHPTVRATLAADHRASDGHVGARFLATVDRLLQTPEDL